MQTVVGYYDSVSKANNVKSALQDKGFNDVTVIDQTGEGYRADRENASGDDSSLGDKIKHFFSGLTSDEDDSHEHYTRRVSAGGAMVAVRSQDDQVDDAADLLEQYGATDVTGDDTSATGSRSQDVGVYDAGDRNYGTGSGTLLVDSGRTGGEYSNIGSGYNGTADYDEARTGGQQDLSETQSIPVIQEDLAVGKRTVNRGGVRVYSHLVSEPVSQSINLHDERVVVDRRAVDRPATEADFAPGDRTIELTATGEEAVVGKTSRVVEEVRVGKQSTDHTEQINDSVRHTEVDVERTGDEETSRSRY